MTVEFPLRYGEGVVLVDAADVDRLLDYRWRLQLAGRTGYARANTTRGPVLMHRLLLAPPDGYFIDHINGDGLDNRRANLRIATHTQNMQNRRGAHRGSSSRYRGVYWDPARGKWRAQVQVNGRVVRIGRFADEYEAALAADTYRREHMPYASPDPALAVEKPPRR